MNPRRRSCLALLPAWALLAGGCAAPVASAPTAAQTWRGVLSRKGSPPGVFWVLLDDAGREWRLLPAPDLEARLPALQHRRVRAAGRLSRDPQGDEIELTSVDAD
ncbi:MAG: hypothetical protein EKK53_14075 [Burkholderiales bacterium]|nr:MAG: hypothetical protein EKK53_14075 [Burkholderiales bacterium]